MVTELHCIDNVRMSVSAISQSVSLCQCKDSSISSAVQKLFISALDENTEESWDKLFTYLDSLQSPQLAYLKNLPETQHYIMRTLCQVQQQQIKRVPLYITERLLALFPSITDNAKADGKCLSIENSPTCVTNKDKKERRFRHIHPCSHSGMELCSYSKDNVPVTFLARKTTTQDIMLSTDDVIADKLAIEQISKRSVVPVLPERLYTSQDLHRKYSKPNLRPVLQSEVETPNLTPRKPGYVRNIKPGRKLDRIFQAQFTEQEFQDSFSLVLRTGQDVVRAYALGALPSGTQEIYLNYGESTPWNPYYLEVVPKIQANPDHFIATKFGLLHVYPDGESEHQSFAGWCRDATVFGIIQRIPIFRCYLTQKMLRQWHTNVRQARFMVVSTKVFNVGLRFYPSFMLALWKVNSLCTDLLSIETVSIIPMGCYNKQQYLEELETSFRKLLKYLKKFLRYVEHVLASLVSSTHTRVTELESRKRHMPFVSEIPISIQKEQHRKLEEDLQEAKHRREQLCYLKIASRHIIETHLVNLVEAGAKLWLTIVLRGHEIQSEEDSSRAILEEMENDVLSFDTSSSESLVDKENRSALMYAPSLLQSELKLNDMGQVVSSLDVSQLRNILMTPLRSTEKAIIKSIETPTTTVTDTQVDVLGIAQVRGGLILHSQTSNNAGGISTSPHIETHSICNDILTESMIEHITNNCVVYESENTLTQVLNQVTEEIETFCDECSWMQELDKFLSVLGNACISRKMSQAMKPVEIENALMSGYKWLDKLSTLPHNFTTSYCILNISSVKLVSSLQPRLKLVMNQLQESCVYTVHSQCLRLIAMAKEHLEILSCKRYDLEGFANYAQQIRHIEEQRDEEHDTLRYSSTLLNSLLVSGVMVSRDERQLVEDTEKLWNECGEKVKEMAQFVDNQTPLKAQGLQENMETCEQELIAMVHQLNTRPYTNPAAIPSTVLVQLKEVQENVMAIQSRLVDLGKWRKAITGHSLDMTAVSDAIKQLFGRQTLWTHQLNFDSIERDWLRIPFKKLNITEMNNKLKDLLTSIEKLSQTLPPEDPVLVNLQDRVMQYHILIPILQQLTSKAIKSSHWHTLLASVEEEYQSLHQYTLQDFFLFRLFDKSHIELITEVFEGAEREAKLKHSLQNLQNRWEKQMLTLQQKTPEPYSFAFPNTSHSPVGEKTTKFFLSSTQQPGFCPVAHVISAGNTQELLISLEEDITQLQVLRGLARASTVKLQVEYWSTVLSQLQEIVSLLNKCQEKWWDTVKLFGQLPVDKHTDCGLDSLQDTSVRLQDIMSSIHDDPFVLSLLEKRRGQKGFRDLQGESLRNGLDIIFKLLENVLGKLKDVILEMAAPFPRLLMLSDSEILHIISHQGNPLLILPSIQKMFPSICNMKVINVEKPNDAQLGPPREEGFQIVSVEDQGSESLTLCVPLPVGKRKSSEWLSALEKAVRYSLSCHLKGCSSNLPLKLTGAVAFEEEDTSVLFWLGESVSQAVILSLECHITLSLKSSLDNEKHWNESLQFVQLNVERAINYCVQLMRSVVSYSVLSKSSSRAVSNTLKKIIILLKHKQEIVKSLITSTTAPSMDTLMYIMYHPYESTITTQNNSRLGSVAASLTTSKSSINQTIPAISRLQNAPEALVGSSKSLLSSKHSQQMYSSKSSMSTKSLLPCVSSIPTYCYVQCGNHWFNYGFEYEGNENMKIVITPNTERCLLHLMHGLAESNGVMLTGDVCSGKKELGKNVAKILGRSVHHLSCITEITSGVLQSILLASIQTGCILVLSGLEFIEMKLQIILCKWINDIHKVLSNSGLVFTEQPLKTVDQSSISSRSTVSISSNLKPGEATPRSRGNQSRIDWYSGEYGVDLLGRKVEIDLWGRKLIARSQFASILVIPERKGTTLEELKSLFRSSHIVEKNYTTFLECELVSNGFTETKELTKALNGCLNDLQNDNSNKNLLYLMKSIAAQSHIYLIESVKTGTIVRHTETLCVMKGVVHVMSITCRTEELKSRLLRTVSKWFQRPIGEWELYSTENKLISAIHREMEDRHLQESQKIIDKILQLHQALHSKSCVIMTGACGSGKTTLYQTLARAYNNISSNKIQDQVCLHTLNPAAYSIEEFIGSYDKNRSNWQAGIFIKLLKKLSGISESKKVVEHKSGTCLQQCAVKHWIILDGPVNEELMTWIHSLLITGNKSITLPNGELVYIPDHCRLLIETPSLEMLTPSLLLHCAVLHCHSLFRYEDVITTWLQRASILHDLCTAGIEVLSSLMKLTLPRILDYIKHFGNDLVDHIRNSTDIDVFLTQKFLALLSSILERNSPKQDDSSTRYTVTSSQVGSMTSRMESVMSIPSHIDNIQSTMSIENITTDKERPVYSGLTSSSSIPLTDPSVSDMPLSNVIIEETDEVLSECSDLETQIFLNQQYQTTTMFLFALIWSFGAYIPYSQMQQFSDFIHEVADNLPCGHEVLPSTGTVFDYYLDLKTYRFFSWSEKKREKSANATSKYISIPELERYAYISDLYLTYGYNVLLIGDEGSGKTAFIKNLIQPRMPSTSIPISPSLTPKLLQTSIITRLALLKKRQGNSKKHIGQRNVFLLDDLHLSSQFPYRHNGTGANTVTNDKPFTQYPKHTPVVELVTLIAEYGCLPDLTRDYTHLLNGVRVFTTSTSNGIRKLSPQLLRHFNTVPFFPLSDDSLCYIVQKILSPWIHKLPFDSLEKNESLVQSIAVASVTVFKNMTARFQSSPTNPHFLFSLRDLSATWEGLLLMASNTNTSQNMTSMGLLGRRGLLRVKEGKTAGRKSTSKTKSGKSTLQSGRKGRQTGRGMRTLPSLDEDVRSTAKSRLPHQQTMPVGFGRQESTPMRKNTYAQRVSLSSSLPVEFKRGGLLQQDQGEEEKMNGLLRSILRLWCHENSRIYGDRLTSSKDKIWIVKLIETCVKYCFCGADIQEADTIGSEGHVSVRGSRRPRPGRPKGGIVQTSAKGGGLITSSVPAVTLHSADLLSNGINFNVMKQLLPKEKQTLLLNYDQVSVRGEDLSGLIFGRLPSSQATGLEQTTQNSIDYIEIGDGEVKDVINASLMKQIHNRNELSYVIPCKQAMEHVIRLCRAFVIPGAHSLLLGPRGSGRKTATKLAAQIINATVYELNSEIGKGTTSILRESCISAGLEGQKVILLVDAEHIQRRDEAWDTLLEIMREGLSANLFTSSELLVMSNKIQPEKLRRTTEAAFQGFAQAIKSNLHVVIVWDTVTRGDSTEVFSIITDYLNEDKNQKATSSVYVFEEHWRALFKCLLQNCSYIDHYQMWTKNAYSEVALHYWEMNQPFSKSSSMGSSELEALSFLAAHVHLTTLEVLKETFVSHSKWMISSRDYVQCLQLGFTLAKEFRKKGEECAQKLHSALSQLYDLERQTSNLQWKLEDELRLCFQRAEKDVKHHMEKITTAKWKYMAASERCRKAEETIDRETKQVKTLKKQVDDKFKEVSPTYYSALEALSSVERTVVMEVMSYRAPPEHLFPVFKALCLLFDRPATWADCQQLMLSQHFFESLRFFDKDGVPQTKLDRLEKLLSDHQKISVKKISEVSQAVVPLVMWIDALVNYRKAKAAVQPYRDQLTLAEKTLTGAQEVYVKMRQEMLATKATLEETVQQHKEAVKKAKVAEADVQSVQKQLDSIQRLLDCLSNQKKNWEAKLSDTQQNLDCLPAASLLTAASCIYLCCLPPEHHTKLWKNWMGYCNGTVSLGSMNIDEDERYKVNIKLQEDFKIQNVLADEVELLVWQRRNIFPDNATLEKALKWRTCLKYSDLYVQVVFDPYSMFRHYVREIFSGADDEETPNDTVIYLSPTQSDLLDQLIHCLQTGEKVVLQLNSLNQVEGLSNILYPFLTWSYKPSPDNKMKICSQEITPHADFQIYIVLPFEPSRPHSFISFILHTVGLKQLTSLEMSKEGLSTLFHGHVLEKSRRELCIQQRALLADLGMHKQEALKCEEAILSHIKKVDWSQLNSLTTEDLMAYINKTESTQTSSLGEVTEAQKALSSITKHTSPYNQLAEHTANLFITCKKLSDSLSQVSVSLNEILDFITSLLHRHENTRFHSSQTSLKAYLYHMENSLTTQVHQKTCSSLFPHQQLLFPLFMSFTKEHKMDTAIETLLFHPLRVPLMKMLDNRNASYPSYIKEDSFCSVDVLEELAEFHGLRESLSTQIPQWEEYFMIEPSLLYPLPLNNGAREISLIKKLALWKVLQPNRFNKAVQSYISLTLGPEFSGTQIIQVPPDSCSEVPLICLFNDCSSLVIKTLSNWSSENNMTVISAVSDDVEYQVTQLMSTPYWTVVNHLYLCKQWIDLFMKLTKLISSSHSLFRLWLPLPANFLPLLKNHMIGSTYHVISFSDDNPVSILPDYHNVTIHSRYSTVPYSVQQLKDIVHKLQNLLSEFKINENTPLELQDGNIQHIHTNLQSMQAYLDGREPYCAIIGHSLYCIVNNSVPMQWRSSGNDETSLVDFIKNV